MENEPAEIGDRERGRERAIAGARAFAECNSTGREGRGEEASMGQSGMRRNAARYGRRGRKFQEGKRGLLARVYVCVCVKLEKKGDRIGAAVRETRESDRG